MVESNFNNLMAVDVGNTNVVLGLWQDGKWTLSWRARTVEDKMPDEYAVLVRNFLASRNMTFADIEGVIISSVVPPLTLAFAELVRRYMEIEPIVVTHQTKTGIHLNIDQPEQAGADRIVNAVAVSHIYGGPAIVVDFGTATTFDVVSADGAYCGGAISPGIMLAHDALVSRAARLHKIELNPPPDAIGTNTIHAMQSGIFWGYVSLVEGLVKRIKTSMAQSVAQSVDEATIKVIATGGLAQLVNEHTDAIDIIEPDLTLEGLRVIYALNRD